MSGTPPRTPPRIVSAGFQMSLDGYIAGPDDELDWMRGSVDMLDHATATMRGIDTMLMGRRTYVEQAASWPHRTGELADAVSSHDKVVFTSRPDEIDLTAWAGSRVSVDPATEIASLRRSRGGRIGVTGGAEFLRRMLGHGLIDEVRVITHPVTLGHGRSPWPAGLRLHLTSAREFDSGANLRIYTTAV